MDNDQLLREIGLTPVWKLRKQPLEPVVAAVPSATKATEMEAPAQSPDGAAGVAGMDWDQLTEAIANCRRCRLCETRKQAVPGVGDREADWLFVGEGPGAEEDERGEPFVGQAGKLLDNMLAAIDLRRGENVYIANTVKCRPPNNRTPEADETAACFPFLQRQIALLQPKLLIALGKPAAQVLLKVDVKVGEARGKRHVHDGIPLIVTYHPAYLLRNLPEKAKSWDDLLFMRRTMATLHDE
jgi:uracil-DNA glycosylase family 4